MPDFSVALALGLVAAAYASVGHGGASAYWTVFALLGFSLAPLKPVVLTMNILVSGIALFHFSRREPLAWKTFLPLVMGSMPFAWLGGRATAPDSVFKMALALMLAVSALRLAIPGQTARSEPRAMPVWSGVLVGAAIGYVAGLTGTGGGVLLTPLLILMGWATVPGAAGLSAAFILLNSLASLPPALAQGLPTSIAFATTLTWVGAAVFGGFIGSKWGSGTRQAVSLKRILAAVLVIGVVKLTVI